MSTLAFKLDLDSSELCLKSAVNYCGFFFPTWKVLQLTADVCGSDLCKCVRCEGRQKTSKHTPHTNVIHEIHFNK